MMKLLKNLLSRKIYFYLCLSYVAWLQLSYKKIRFIVAVLGVAVSITLIFTQIGLKEMLFDGVNLLPESLNGDLYLVSSHADNIRSSSFSSIYLYQADAVKGVASTKPLYIGFGRWIDPKFLEISTEDQADIKASSMQIIAFNLNKPVFNNPEINRQSSKLFIPGSILYDRLAKKSETGNISQLFSSQEKVFSILDNRRVVVVGLFSLGSTFYYDGVAVMSDWNYGQIEGMDKLKEISLGIVSLEPGADSWTVAQQINKNLDQEIKVLTKKELVQAEKDDVRRGSAGKILNFGVVIGFIVGIIIVYQVIYTDVSEHLPQYATLKAMGFTNFSLSLLVLQESLILAIIGFIPGYFASYGIYYLMAKLIELPINMDIGIARQVFILNITMCSISGAIAIKKLIIADPADIF